MNLLVTRYDSRWRNIGQERDLDELCTCRYGMIHSYSCLKSFSLRVISTLAPSTKASAFGFSTTTLTQSIMPLSLSLSWSVLRTIVIASASRVL